MIPVKAKSVVKYGGKWHIPGDARSELFSVAADWLERNARHVEVLEPPMEQPVVVPQEEAPVEVQGLPDALPWLEVIRAAGIATLEDLLAVADLTTIPGIGNRRAGEISAFLEGLR